jgi:hypothetical protein
VHLPRTVLLSLCALLTATAYYLLLFTTWASTYQGSSPTRNVITYAAIMLAAFCCLEVLRNDPAVPVRAVAGAVGFPLVLVTLLTLWYGLRRFVAG